MHFDLPLANCKYFARPNAMQTYEFNLHEGGESYQYLEKWKFLKKILG